jgi:SAM-dependent methyltransferase
MEVGCGQGALATLLARRFEYVGYEPDEVSYLVARDRLARLERGHVVNSPVPDEPERNFDVVGAFEVLEHIEDDTAALTSWIRWLRPGGHLLLSVPANPARFGPADEYAGHFRRYTRDGLRTLLERSSVIESRIIAYGFPLGYALEFARNRILASRLGDAPDSLAARTTASGRRLQPRDGLGPLVWAATLPFAYLQRPFANGDIGTGFVAHARRPA